MHDSSANVSINNNNKSKNNNGKSVKIANKNQDDGIPLHKKQQFLLQNN